MDSAKSSYRSKSILNEKTSASVADVCYTPLSAKTRITQDDDDSILLEGARQLEGIAIQYNSEHMQHTQMIDLLADEVSRVHENRKVRIEKRKNQLHKYTKSAFELKQKAQDIAILEEYEKDLQLCFQEKNNLSTTIQQAKDQYKQTKEQLMTIEENIDELRSSQLILRHKLEGELPTLQYILKILRLLSAAKISSTIDSDVLEGFICKNEQRDLIPFQFDKTNTSQYERVNAIWDIIDSN